MRRVVPAAVAIALALVLVPASAWADDCDAAGWVTNCEVSNSGTSVDLGASATRPGGEDAGSSHPEGALPAPPAEPAPPPCGPICRPGYTVESPPDVTLSDLASFVPARPSLSGEPAGFGVVGMPTNLVAAASEQWMPGTLLGWDVVVRFVPAGFVFDHGDGTSAYSSTGGLSWASIPAAQFTPTATSHVYRERGTYSVGVTVQYAASVDFGRGWRPVAGFVTSTTGGYDVQVVEVSTALVDRSCAEDPTGPGC